MDRAKAMQPGMRRRRFDGAVVDRLTSSWMATNVAIDQELRTDLDRLRARSRDLFKNNEYVAKFGRMVRNNIVGPEGFSFHARSVGNNGKLDAADNATLEAAFWDWQQPRHCDVTGRRAFVDIIRGAVLAMARDGEFLIRKVRNAGKYGFQLQPLNVDRLDTTYNISPANGRNAIIMGVEVDAVRRPVAYWLWSTTADAGALQRVRERIPADEIYHGFVPMEEEQTRGVPWVHAAMRILNDLKGYREAAVIAARIGASKMGFWETPDNEPPPGAEPDAQHPGSHITSVEPGVFDYAPPGYKLHTYDPTYPHEQFDAFCNAALRGVASALGVSHPSLASNLSDVNYSSIRAGVQEERDEWMVMQSVVVNQLLTPIYEDWLDMALLRGAIVSASGSALPASKRSKFSAHLWQGRRWPWVDPVKDIEAAVIGINNRLNSPQQVAMQTGRDIEDVLDDIAVFQQLAAAKGVELPGPASGTGGSPPVPSQ